MRLRLIAFALVSLAAACGGGGSSGSSGGGTIAAPNSTATGSPSTAASATPTATPTSSAAADVVGVAVDDQSGAPIAGAIVYVSESTAIGGATPLPASETPWPTATTGINGSFDVKNVKPSTWDMNFSFVGTGYPNFPTAQWITILPADGHAPYHAIATIATTGTTNVGTITIAQPSATDNAWLAQINTDRATVGIPAVTTPLIFDSITLQTSRYWAMTMASVPFYAHQCPTNDVGCVGFWEWQTTRGSLPSSQNIDLGSPDWQVAEAAFMAEIANCPGGTWQNCAYAENTGHYINIMSATYWAGVGIAAGPYPSATPAPGASQSPSGGSSSSPSPTPTGFYYAENFTSPSGYQYVEALRRSLSIR